MNMNVRRMTMLPVEEMRKLSQMVKVTSPPLYIPQLNRQDEANKKSDDEYPEVPTDAPAAAPAGEDAPPAAETPADAAAPAPAAEEEVKGEPEL